MRTLNQLEKDHIALAEEDIIRLFPSRNIQRVLILIPPDAEKQMFNFATAKRGRYWNFPAYGPGLMAAHMRKQGIDVDLLNLNNEVLKACSSAKSEQDFDFDFYGFYCYLINLSSQNILYWLEIISY